ncbi:hypothetical protein QLL95_gp0985 [Cotonvirus japonicus]|uniref:Uncharacterized protein n=1 Tax=Cotonvirus japonicus TaxID=2811091 RepID=A0ABM7NSJ4_9VIRU|nr:hypothetical protein QLL95_gp0985 [Cotonvirus japonicus]BCS83138.1 hypothetical protein [Cotonvirus japonicus]
MSNIYFVKCDNDYIHKYTLFTSKLKTLQKYCRIINVDELSNLISDKSIVDHCNIYYIISNIIWCNNIEHNMKKYHKFPSKYFVDVIINTCCINDTIINPPIVLSNKNLSIKYISLSRNKLLIIDALMNQGSKQIYSVPKTRTSQKKKYVYSEHSGVLTIKKNLIDNIIVSAQTSRLDMNDSNIYLPYNVDMLDKYEFLFHTHPNSSKYAGRLDDGVLYEFPSANDIFNFMKYHNNGIAQASLIATPEGMYVIRPIFWKKYVIDMEFYANLKDFIMKIEKLAIKRLTVDKNQLSNPDIFNEVVGQNMRYIGLYNEFVKSHNIFVEYYPRINKNNEWYLRKIYLQYVKH